MFEEVTTGEVKSSGEFVVPGFGKLVRSERKAGEGRSPDGRTGEGPGQHDGEVPDWKAMKDSALPAMKK
jgi:nucleoid DNA-binding protein